MKSLFIQISIISTNWPLWLVLWSRVTYDDLVLKQHYLLLSMLKTAVLLNIFVETVIRLFKMLWCIESSKEHNLLQTMSLLSFINFWTAILCHCFSFRINSNNLYVAGCNSDDSQIKVYIRVKSPNKQRERSVSRFILILKSQDTWNFIYLQRNSN